MPKFKKKAIRVPDKKVDSARAFEQPAAKIGQKPSFAQLEYKVQKFASPTWRQAAGCWLFLNLIFSAIGFGARLSPSAFIFVAVAFSLLCVLIGMGMMVQRMEIDGPIVKISNLHSFYRYRQFDVREVDYVRLCLPQTKSVVLTFQINLKPSPNRKWNQVILAKLEGWDPAKSTNCAINIALVEAIRQKQPGFTVQNLPRGYSGPLGESAYR